MPTQLLFRCWIEFYCKRCCRDTLAVKFYDSFPFSVIRSLELNVKHGMTLITYSFIKYNIEKFLPSVCLIRKRVIFEIIELSNLSVQFKPLLDVLEVKKLKNMKVVLIPLKLIFIGRITKFVLPVLQFCNWNYNLILSKSDNVWLNKLRF